MTSTSGSWAQARISMAGFAGQSNIQLRFDFTTGGAWPNTVALAGSNLGALSGEMLEDGETFTVASADGKTVKTFEFDMGAAYQVPNVAGDALADGQTFTLMTLDANGNPVPLQTFEFDNNGHHTGRQRRAFPSSRARAAAEVAAEIATVVNGLALTNSAGVTIVADVYGDRVVFNGADMGMVLRLPAAGGAAITDGETFTIMTRDAGGNLVPLHTFEFDNNGHHTAGNTAITYKTTDSAATIAAAIVAAVNKLNLTNTDGVPVVAYVSPDGRVLLNGAEGIKQSANPAVIAGVDGSGA